MIQGPKSRNFLYIGPVWRIRDYMRSRYKGIFCVVAFAPAGLGNAFRYNIYRDAGVYSCKLCPKSDGGFRIARHAGFDPAQKRGTISHGAAYRYRDSFART